ncbi:MAG: homoaconitase, partial [Planctomycetota bacterium]
MSNGPRNLVQKIAARHLIGGGDVTPGSFVRIKPRRVMSHDNSAAIINKFTGLFTTGFAPTIADPTQPVICLDHDIQNLTPDNLGKYARIEKF